MKKEKTENATLKSLLKYKKLALGILGVLLGILFAFVIAPPEALCTTAEAANSSGRDAMIVIGSLVWAICWWIGGVVPDWCTSVGLMIFWTVFGVCEFGVAFSQYSGSIVWLLIGAFLVSGAVVKTGALKRISLTLMKVFPATFKGQVLALMLSGTVVSPLVPSSTAKAVLGANLSLSTAKAMRLEPYGKGMTGMYMAGWTGFSLTVPAFITACAFGFMLKGALPEDIADGLTFGNWLLTMLPWLIVLLVGMFIVINILYKPKSEVKFTKEDVQAEFDAMGKMSKKEIISMVVLFACVVFWIFENTLGVAAEITALIGAIICFLVGILEPKDLAQRVAWPLILFIGGAMQLGNMFSLTGINGWLTILLKPVFLSIGSKFVLVIFVALSITILRFFVASQGASIMLFTAILTPVAVEIGINPFVMGLIVYVSQQLWFAPYQNTTYAPTLSVMEGYQKHVEAVKGCLGYIVVSLIGLIVSVPVWSLMGYM